VLRAHYTMDVFAGAVTAVAAAGVADRLAPACDAALINLGTALFGG
jgi:membrane-associated phospholipid phosphatase